MERTRAHLNYDLYVRYLELFMLLKEKNFALASDKLEATVKFIRRNFSTYRVEIEKQHWPLLKAVMKGEQIKPVKKRVYRLSDFIFEELADA